MNNDRSEYFFFWFIENYSYCFHKNEESLVSPSFTMDEMNGETWTLSLYPRGARVKDEGYISLFLNRSYEDNGPEKVSIQYELSFLAANGSAFRCDRIEHEFERRKGYGFGKFFNRDKILLRRRFSYLPDDTLTVRCRIWKGEGNVRDIGQSSARTRIRVEKYSFFQVIERFSTLQPNAKLATKIPSHSKNGLFVKCSLYYNDEGMLIIEIVPAETKQILGKCECSLLNHSGSLIGCGETDNRYKAIRKNIYTLSLSLKKVDILSRKTEYVPDDKLSLFCECTFSSGIECQTTEETLNRVPLALMQQKAIYETAEEKQPTYPSVVQDIKTLYTSGCLTDVEVRTQTNSFPAHKTVLCARSPVFKTMMTSDMKEKITNSIYVDDLKDDVVQQLLLFLYSDSIDNLQWESATQLYYAADKYQIAKLKELCSSFLVENLTPTNVVELLLLADAHSDNNLKTAVEDFILVHEEQVFCSKEWEMIMETNLVLARKIMQLKYKRKSETSFLHSWRKKGKFL